MTTPDWPTAEELDAVESRWVNDYELTAQQDDDFGSLIDAVRAYVAALEAEQAEVARLTAAITEVLGASGPGWDFWAKDHLRAVLAGTDTSPKALPAPGSYVCRCGATFVLDGENL